MLRTVIKIIGIRYIYDIDLDWTKSVLLAGNKYQDTNSRYGSYEKYLYIPVYFYQTFEHRKYDDMQVLFIAFILYMTVQ